MTPLEFLEQQEADLEFAYNTGLVFGSDNEQQGRTLHEVQEQAVEQILIEAANEIVADDEGIKSVLNFYLDEQVQALGESEGRSAADAAGEAAKKRFAWRVVLALGSLAKRFIVATASWILNAARTIILGISRIAFRFIIQPLITGLAAFLASPTGLVVLGAAATAGAGYVAYRALVRGDSLSSIFGMDGEEGKVGEFETKPPTHLRNMYLTEDGRLVDVPYLDDLDGVDYDRDTDIGGARAESFGGELAREHAPSLIEPEEFPAPSRERARESARRAERRAKKGKTQHGKLSESALVRALDEAQITNRNERAMFLGQMSHESGGFRFNEEVWGPTAIQLRYQNHKYLGNKYKGDGYKFRGRGYIQLTGRDNYTRAGKYLGIDLAGNPDLAADPDIAARIALWYWQVERPRIPALARAGNIRQVTRLINGGEIGLADRTSRYRAYLARINAGELTPSNVASVEKMDAGESPTTTAQRRTRRPQQVSSVAPSTSNTSVAVHEQGESGNYFKHNGMIVVS